ncbi:MAG: hypothetical protein GY904_25855, partial [Planctomycetaceae bacterium]|nr:hypothetical protein [Planctomycetaceae bacterium]
MKLCFRVILAVWLAVSATTVRSTAAEPSDSAKVDFIKKVQPILAKKCYACHGPDEAESGLRFDQQASAFGEAESGDHAIVAGDIAASELIARIKSDDEFER